MTRLGSTDPTLIRFGYPSDVRRRGRVECLLATAGFLALALVGDRQAPWWIASMVAVLSLLALGAAAMLRTATFEVDLRSRTYSGRRNTLHWRRTVTGSADEIMRIETQSDAGGGAVRVVSRRGTWTVLRDCDPFTVVETARQLGEILGVPAGPADRTPTRRRKTASRIVRLVGWGASASLVAMLAAPLADALSPIWLGGSDHPHTMSGRSAWLLQEGYRRYWSHDPQGAAVALSECLRLDQHNVEALNMLAYAYADQDLLDDALRVARRALRNAPADGNIIDTVGEMYERRRDFHAAADYYRQALRYIPVYASSQTHAKYGRTLLALGHTSEAREHLELAVALGMNDRWTRLAQALIRHIDRKSDAAAPQNHGRIASSD